MTLTLDERQRAMLAEMGVRLWDQGPATRAIPAAQGAPAVQGVKTPRAQAPATAEAPRAALGGPGNEGSPASPVDAAPRPPQAQGQAHHPAGVEAMGWDELAEAVAGCQACGLCQGRRNTVFGVGDRQADWMIVGEAPGENEDLRGEPFVGNAGQLLDNMLRAVGLDRSHRVYITNVIKCRPPGNRNPEPAEIAQCEPFLRRQIALVKPRLILAMGRFAVQSLLATQEPIGKLRGRVHRYQDLPVVVTYHPAYLLRNMPDKAKAWADLCLALAQAPPRA